MIIFVTGAAGKTGLAVIRALSEKGHTIRALVHRDEQIRTVQAAGADAFFVGDMNQKEILLSAGRGIQAIYHICPNVSPNEFAIGRNVIEVAQDHQIEHFVYHSVLHPQIRSMPHHWEKMRVEELIFESGLDYTILQPAAYMQNVLVAWEKIMTERVYPVPYPPETKLGMVDLQDVAETAAIVIGEGGHSGATYELAGAQVLSQVEVASILSQVLKRPVKAIEENITGWQDRMKASGMGTYQIESLTKMFNYYARHGFWGNSHTLENLLGRAPNTFEIVVNRHVAAL